MRSLRHLPLIAIAACVFAAASVAVADDEIPPSPIVKTQLVVNAPASMSANTALAGVQFTIPEHWHIYWLNPGDSGLTTSYQWTLPAGITASEILWPVPERLDVSTLTNYGYSNQVTLPVTLTAQGALQGEIAVKASWLVCKDVCIPESATLTATLPVQTDNAAAILQAARNAVPQQSLSATYSATHDAVTLTVPVADATQVTKAYFFPIDDGIIANNAPQEMTVQNDAIRLSLKRGSAEAVPTWKGVLVLTRGTLATSYQLDATLTGVDATVPTPPIMPAAPDTSFVHALALALLGGLILNVMPCVLPILALKALAITRKAGLSRAAAARQGISYTAGVVSSFLLIAGGMLLLKASGAAIGWGFQLQEPAFVAALAVVMLAVAANLLGLFELPVLLGTRASQTDEDTLGGAFMTGALAVLVATPCTAPFMATAIGATLTFPTLQALGVFAALGFGMALPFLIISLWPAARRLLPKPGAWMKRFRHFLALPMLATAAWLVWVFLQLLHPMHSMDAAHEPYSAARLAALRAEGTPVLVDATADWCLTCKINERVALQPEAMQKFLYEQNVILLVADWTANDPQITAYLASFNRNGVPLYVYYPPRGEPVILPQILTPTLIREVVSGSKISTN